MNRIECKERNAQILQMRLEGKSPKEIGNTFNLSKASIYQIVKKQNTQGIKIIRADTLLDRNAQIFQMRTNGKYLQEIGNEFNISRERIRQLLKQYHNKTGRLEKKGGINCPICGKTFFNTNKNRDRTHCSRECQQAFLEARNNEIVFLKDRNVSYQEIARIYHLAPRTISNIYWKMMWNPRKRTKKEG